jgi:drug/metabolite transporter (DMT)-like permease
MKFSPYILLILTNLFFSTNIVAGKVLVDAIPPMALTFLRWSLSFIILLPFCWKELQNDWKPLLTKWPLILLLGATGYSICSILFYEAVHYTTAINTAFINAFVPLMVAIVSYIFYRDELTIFQIIGFILSFCGVIWIVFQGDWSRLIGLKLNIGDLLMLMSVIFVYPLYSVFYQHEATHFPQRSLLALMILAALIISFPPAILETALNKGSWIGQIQFSHLLALLGICIFPSVLANLFLIYALKYVPANVAGVFHNLILIFATIMSVIFLGEKLYSYHFTGGLLILIGAWQVTRKSPVRKASEL